MNPMLSARRYLGAAVWLVFLAGCGLGAGYAPDKVVVHSAAGLPGAAVPDSVRVVTWNIQYGEALDTALAELRAHPRLASADILLLQELDTEGAAFLADSLGFYHVYASAAVHPHHARLFGNAVLSRWPIVGRRSEMLPHPTPVTGHRRLALTADLDLGRRGVLHVVSVHTATVIIDQEKRLAQAAAALDSLGPGPVIVAGDFNTATEWDVTRLRRLGRHLGFSHLRLSEGPTVSNRIRKMPGQDLVMDHVFYRGLTAGARGVVRATAASDHYPVWAVFALPPLNQE